MDTSTANNKKTSNSFNIIYHHFTIISPSFHHPTFAFPAPTQPTPCAFRKALPFDDLRHPRRRSPPSRWKRRALQLPHHVPWNGNLLGRCHGDMNNTDIYIYVYIYIYIYVYEIWIYMKYAYMKYEYIYIYRRANYFRNFFWSGLGIIFGFLLLCFSCFSCFSAFPAFPAFPASLLFCVFAFLLLLLLAFSAFLLFCFSCFSCCSASLLFCFFAFLFFLFLCFSAFPASCFSAFPASLPFCCFAFVRFLFLCFSAFFALPALNTWFSCKMHFAQYLHPWVSHDQPSLEN